MSAAVHLVPLGLSAVLWFVLHLANRRSRLFRVGEIVFWDAIILIVVFLVWLRWF